MLRPVPSHVVGEGERGRVRGGVRGEGERKRGGGGGGGDFQCVFTFLG